MSFSLSRPLLASSTLAPMALIALACATPAQAVTPVDTFSFKVAGYLNSFDTTVSANGGNLRGTRVDLHEDLGLDKDNTIAAVTASWRPFEHHEFEVGWFNDDLDATRRLDRQIDFDGDIYPVDATVKTKLNMDAYQASYVWWAAMHENWALGPRLGLVWYRMSLDLTLVELFGQQVNNGVSSSVSADLPAPSLGGSWRWTPGEHWRVYADAGYFSANSNGVDADVTFGRAGIEWYPWDHFGFLLDYSTTHIDGDVDRRNWDGTLDFNDSGLRLGASYRF